VCTLDCAACAFEPWPAISKTIHGCVYASKEVSSHARVFGCAVVFLDMVSGSPIERLEKLNRYSEDEQSYGIKRQCSRDSISLSELPPLDRSALGWCGMARQSAIRTRPPMKK